MIDLSSIDEYYDEMKLVQPKYSIRKAIRWLGRNWNQVIEFAKQSKSCTIRGEDFPNQNHMDILVTTLNGEVKLPIGDWLMLGVQGELYPCAHSIFVQTYSEVVR